MSRKIKETYHRLGELLVRKGVAKPHEIDAALAVQRAHIADRKSPPKLGEILIERNVLTKKIIRELLDEQKSGRGEKRHLTFGLRESGGVAVVVLQGRLDESNQAAVTKVLERLMNRGFARVALDCTKLVHLNSHSISAFVGYIDEARVRGGDLKFFGMGFDARFVLDRLELTKFVQIFDTEKEAIHAFDLPIDEYMSRGALGEYVAPASTKTFHLSYCKQVQKTREDEKLYFESKRHAREAGRKPCTTCKP